MFRFFFLIGGWNSSQTKHTEVNQFLKNRGEVDNLYLPVFLKDFVVVVKV